MEYTQRNAVLSKRKLILKYRRKSLWLVAIYIPLLVIPWVINCVLMYRPLGSPSYVQQHTGLSQGDVLNIYRWLDAINVLNKIQAVIAIPVVSALIAQAAVVYSQRRSTKQKLSLRQLIALADHSWADISGWWSARHTDIGSRLVWLGGLLILLVSIQPPLQSLLGERIEPILVAACYDVPVVGCNGFDLDVVGYDAEPSALQYLPQNVAVQRVFNKIITVNVGDVQPYLWPETWNNTVDIDRVAQSTLGRYHGFETPNEDRPFFVSSLLNGTTTGVLREHALRLNSSSQCQNVLRSDFPTTCSGQRPLVVDFQNSGIEIRICAPGAYDQTAWTISRDRQDITEDLWIDTFVPDPLFYVTAPFGVGVTLGNFTVRCTTNTTRGYFELGNYQNGYNNGPLLDEWPSPEDLSTNFNDFIQVLGDSDIPSAMDNFTDPYVYYWPRPIDTFGTYGQIAPGPLMISALAMFGNNSFWYVARNVSANNTAEAYNALSSICQSGATPFADSDFELPNLFNSAGDVCNQIFSGSIEIDQSEVFLDRMLYTWIYGFNSTGAASAIQAATYFANEAVLTTTADLNPSVGTRNIYTSEGTLILKPSRSVPGLIVNTILIALQLAGIIYLLVYILKTPTWTDKLDSFALMRIGAEMERTKYVDLPPFRDANEEDLERMKEVDGLIGVVLNLDQHRDTKEGSLSMGSLTAASFDELDKASLQGKFLGSLSDVDEMPFRLAVGAQGLVTKHLVLKDLAAKQEDDIYNLL